MLSVFCKKKKYFSVIVSASYQYYHYFITIIIVIIMTPIQSINNSIITLPGNSSARYPNFMFPAPFLIVLSPKFTITPILRRCCLINVFPMKQAPNAPLDQPTTFDIITDKIPLCARSDCDSTTQQ